MTDMYLDEMEQHDIENLEYVLKKSKVNNFMNPIQAEVFVKDSLTSILNRCGCFIDRNTPPEEAERQLRETGVKVENRKYDGEDRWRSGIYVYKEDEIAGFISVLSMTQLGVYKVRSTENP